MNNQIELQARQIETKADADAWHKKTCLDLSELIRKHKIPAGLKEMTPSADLDYKLCDRTWEWTEFKQKKFWGAFFDSVEAANNPFKNWPELIGLIANSVASARALSNAKQDMGLPQ